MICVAKCDAKSGADFKHAQMKAAYCCYMGVLVSNPNSNTEVFYDANPAAGSAIPHRVQIRLEVSELALEGNIQHSSLPSVLNMAPSH